MVAAASIGRREQNKLEKRGRIVAAARALFTYKGFEETTSQEIADAAGVAVGTIFTYARTKDDLLILVFHDEMLAVVERAYASARKSDGIQVQVVAFFDTMVAYHEQDLPLAHALMRQLGFVSSADQRALIGELMTSVLGKLAQLVDGAKADGQVGAAVPLMTAARSLFAIYYFHLGSMLSGYIDRTQFDRALRSGIGLLLTGLE
ncbi:MAG: TetR/AcrR family transcriptional regulator [Phenylobacterium sp.]|nr:MAG: TetR/AcrR family transcriptional regulator [Phenylobacterium sp.]